ncbi:MAG: hypothetical protein GY696_21815 [Gammaproteobacteria bacterium]|nr:hypothetical protein [Gammaproteobacteria bacterium]
MEYYFQTIRIGRLSFSVFAVIVLVFLLGMEPALANKFETIGGGVGGIDREKLVLLKQISLILGGFLALLGILALLTKGRFEGVIGMSSGKKNEAAMMVPVVLIVLGGVFVGLSFL